MANREVRKFEALILQKENAVENKVRKRTVTRIYKILLKA